MDKKIKQLLKLNNTEFNVLELMSDNKEKRFAVQEVATELKKNRTTIQKIISKLKKLEYIQKKQINLNRGFQFIYSINPKFKKDLIFTIDKKIIVLKKLKEDIELS